MTSLGAFPAVGHAQSYDIDGGTTETVDGSGGGDHTSPWGLGGALKVGATGTGTLTIQNGAEVGAEDIYIGDDAGSNGTVTVDGSEITVGTMFGIIYVGYAGEGGLTLTDSSATAAGMLIGQAEGSSGAVTVTGSAATLTTSANLSVGYSGTATLDIQNGATASVGKDLLVGYSTTGVGTVSVSGATTSLTIVNDLETGHGGTGTVEIEDGAEVSVGGDLNLGFDTNGDGTLRVSGETASLSVTGSLASGTSGTGTVEIEDGAKVTTGSDLALGVESGSSGSLGLSGASSSLSITGDLNAGASGTGIVEIEDGATVSVGSDLLLGSEAGGSGTARIDHASLSAAGDITVGASGSGTLTVSGGGEAEAGSGTVTVARDASGTGTVNIGASAGDDPAEAGTLSASTLVFGSGDGNLVFNHTGTDYVFSLDVTGDGTIGFFSGTTYLTGDYSGFSGAVSIDGGSLSVDTTLTADISVNEDGTLSGAGTLGSVSLTSGGMLAPGNSVGTLNVSGATFNSGSTYQVELNDGGFVAGTNNDLLAASGAVTINGGTVHVTPENGVDDGATYSEGTYTIITAASVTGTFDEVTDDFVFFEFTDSYDATGVYLTSEKTVTFPEVAETANQQAVAGPLEALGSGNSVYDALAGLSGSENDARAAFDALSGEVHASVKTALLEDSRFLREAALDRLRKALDRRDCVTAATGPDTCKGAGVWGRAYGSWSDWDGDGNAAGTERSIGGFVLGSDVKVLDTVSIGAMAGFSRTELSVGDRASSGSWDSYTLGAYAGGEWRAFSLKSGLAHSWHVLDTSRTAAFEGFSESLHSSYDARTLQTFAEAAYSFDLKHTRLQPFGGFAYVHENTDSYSETGGSAALSARDQSSDATFTTLGLRGNARLNLGGTKANIAGSLGWRHAFGSTPTAVQAFSGGDAFTVAGVPLARDVLVLGAGIGMNVTDHATVGLSYSGQFGSGIFDHGAKASVNVSF
mgnify:CR=1 FL=1